MVPAPFSTTINRGADFTFAFQIRDGGNCAPVSDLTGWLISATLANSAGTTLATPVYALVNLTCATLKLTFTQTAALTAQTNASLTILAVRPDGLHLRLARGRVTII